jgi:hypothetical protein
MIYMIFVWLDADFHDSHDSFLVFKSAFAEGRPVAISAICGSGEGKGRLCATPILRLLCPDIFSLSHKEMQPSHQKTTGL